MSEEPDSILVVAYLSVHVNSKSRCGGTFLIHSPTLEIHHVFSFELLEKRKEPSLTIFKRREEFVQIEGKITKNKLDKLNHAQRIVLEILTTYLAAADPEHLDIKRDECFVQTFSREDCAVPLSCACR